MKPINANKFFVRDASSLSVPGQNEKDIWVDPRTGYEYIAKKAGKNGRTETMTEYVLNLIGLRMGMRMAEPHLATRGGEFRFMSKKFHGDGDALMHGHEFLAQFWSKEEIAAVHHNSREERRLYSIANVIAGFEAAYMTEADKFIRPFVKMLFFDAAVGCQDRHPKNWGIICSVKGGHPDRFAPIFDTARGLFWEFSTSQLKAFTDVASERYTRRSRPPIGDFSGEKVTHFLLAEQIVKRYPGFRPMLGHIVSVRKEQSVMALLDSMPQIPKTRRWQLKQCINARFVTLRKLAASN